jgi:hypothetical protein
MKINSIILISVLLSGCVVESIPPPAPPVATVQVKRNPRNAPWDKNNPRNAYWDCVNQIYRFPYHDLTFNQFVPENKEHPKTAEELEYTNEMFQKNTYK